VTRLLVLLAVLVFIGGFAFLTLSVIVKQGGITVLSLLSLLIVVLLAVGIVGALRNPPRK
jgi:drug/metabolite transporter (DMT)-like permease